MRIRLATAALVGLSPIAAGAEPSCHLDRIFRSGVCPARVKAGGSCRVDRNHQPGASSAFTKARDHGAFDLQASDWTYQPNPGFKGRDTSYKPVTIASRPSSNVFIAIDMDVR